MILESRSIIFSDEELILALQSNLEELEGGPTATGVESDLDDNGEVAVTLSLDNGQSVTFGNKEVGAAVLNHCIDRGIPLPRGSYKELAIRGDHVALIVRLESGPAADELDSDEY